MPKGKKYTPKEGEKELYNKILNSKKLKQCYNRCTPRSKENYPSCWRDFFLFIKQNPDTYLVDMDTIIDKAKEIKYRKKVEDDILSFFNHLKEEKGHFSPSYVIQFKSAIYKFLKTFNIRLSDNFNDDLKILIPKRSNVTEQIISEREEFEKIFNFLTTQGKAMFLMQITSGGRIEEILDVRIEDLDLRYKFPRFRVRYNDSKNGNSQRKRCSREAKKWIQLYLSQRSKWLETKNNRSKGKGRTGLEGRLFPMTKQNAITYIWNTALEKAGLNEIDPQSGIRRRSTHTLRKYFRKQCKKAGGDKFGRWMANHERNMDDTYIYDTYTDKEIDEEYSKVEKELLIFETTDVTNEVVEKLKNRLEKLETEKKFSKEDKDYMETLINNWEQRFEKIERIAKRLEDDKYALPTKGIQLTPDELEYEEKLEEEAIDKREEDINNLLKQHKDSKKIYIDGVPYLVNADVKEIPKKEITLTEVEKRALKKLLSEPDLIEELTS